MVTEKDIESGEIFDDTIAVFPAGGRISKHPHLYFPYRCLVPQKVDGLLVACRAFSSDQLVNTHYNLIPHCIAFGEAAGVAAAMASDYGVEVRKVDTAILQEKLLDQGVLLPGIHGPRQEYKVA